MSTRNTFNIPSLPSEFDTYQDAAVSIIITKATAFGIPATEITHLTTSKSKWDELAQLCANDSTKGLGATANRNEFQQVYSEEIASIIQNYLLTNALIIAADKLTIHIHTLSGSRIPLPTPESTVYGMVTYKEPLAHYFSFLDSETNKKAKPKGVSFVELRYLKGIIPPNSVDECNNTIFLNKNNKKVQFTSDDDGKKAYYFGRYVNKHGIYGPWCAMFSAGIV